jgi:hypothetical protein
MADEQDTPEVASIVSHIQSWLKTHHNKLELDFTKDPIEFGGSSTDFTSRNPQLAIILGFNDEGVTKDSSLDQIRANFNYIALNKLPVPGLEGVPPKWEIYPQTPISSFSEGVTFENYDTHTQILQFTVQTSFFAIYGRLPQKNPVACAPSPKGTYLQVREDIQGHIKIRAKLVFN